ncbi:MAG: hypothetical protein K2J00_00945 [Bacteroidaceae bacterium]|nr:hypothetical protein [Bacteroidaceae bacterium]
MKKLFLFAAMLLSCVAFAGAQDVQEPDFEFEPFVLDGQNAALGDPLPCENAYVKAKAGASMYIVGAGKVKSYYYVAGNTSSLALDNCQSIVINTGGKSPMQTVSINRFDVLRNKRRFQNGELGTFTGASAGNDKNAQNFRYKKYGKNSVVIPLSNLEPGEYCVSIINTMTNSKSAKVYTFSIK